MVGEVKYRGLPQNPNTDPDVYIPLAQTPVGNLFLAARSGGDPNSLVAAVRGVLQKLDPNLPAYEVTTMGGTGNQSDDAIAFQRLAPRRLRRARARSGGNRNLQRHGLCGGATVPRNRRPRGVGRARRRRAERLIGQGMRLALLGVALGMGAALALTQLMKRLLFGVGAADPLTYGAIALLLMLVALLACYVPARRATKVDPIVAIRMRIGVRCQMSDVRCQ